MDSSFQAKTSSIPIKLSRKDRSGKRDWIAEFHITYLEGGKHPYYVHRYIYLLTLLSTLLLLHSKI